MQNKIYSQDASFSREISLKMYNESVWYQFVIKLVFNYVKLYFPENEASSGKTLFYIFELFSPV